MSDREKIIGDYITSLFAGQDDALQRALEDSPKKGLPAISIRPEEGRFLQFLVRACGAVKALEIGTLGGYSGIWIARGLAPGGRLITLEHDPHHAGVAQEHFSIAGLEEQIEIRHGNAHLLLPDLEPLGPFDFVFIDAEKTGYPAYFDWALEHTRLGGVIAAHNALRGGRVADPLDTEENTLVMRAFNQRVAQEPRVISTIYPGGDGTLVAVKIA